MAKMQQINLGTALKWPLYCQNCYLVSSIRPARTTTEFRLGQPITAYIGLMLLMYCIGCGYILVTQNDTTMALHHANGLLWSLLFDCLTAMGRLSLICMVTITIRRRSQELEFLLRINEIDRRIQRHCHHHIVIISNRNLYVYNCIALTLYSIYYAAIFIVSVYKLITRNVHNPLYIFAYSFTYHIESIAFTMIILKVVNYMAIIWNRLEVVATTMLFDDVRLIRGLFKDLIECLHQLADFMGWQIISKLAHDFFLGTSISYLIATIVMEDASQYRLLVGLSVWLGQTVHRAIILSLFASLTLRQVK